VADGHVDYSVLATLRDVMEGEYLNLIDVFLVDSTERVRALQQMQHTLSHTPDHAAQLHELGMIAHSFKGSSSNMGAVHLAQLCSQLEDLARGKAQAEAGRIQVLIGEISCEYQIVRELFDTERQSLITQH
jgi:HPt (histidine-containing phosphotransfer) domain-containing protein